MKNNSEHMKDIIEIFQFYLLWPKIGVSKKWLYIKIAVAYSMCFVVTDVLTLIDLFNSTDLLTDKIQDISIIIFLSTSYLIIAEFSNKIQTFPNTLEAYFKEMKQINYPLRNVISKNARKFHYVVIICVFSYSIAQVFINKRRNFHPDCPMVLPIWLPISCNNFLIKIIIFMIQFGVVAALNSVFIMMPYMYAYLMWQIIDSFTELRKEIGTVSKGCSLEKFARLVHIHRVLIRFIEDINDFWDNMALLLYVTSSVISGLGAYALIKGNIPGTISFILWITGIGFCCIVSQEVTNECEKLEYALYDIEWYEFEDKTMKRNVLFMLTRTQKSLFFKAGPLSSLSAPFFYNVLKSSYTIVTFLNGIK